MLKIINAWELGLCFVKYLLALPVSSADPINFTAKSSNNTAGRTATMSGPGGKFLQETTHHITKETSSLNLISKKG